MELRKFTKGSWRIYFNGRFMGYLTDYGKGYEITINGKDYNVWKSELKKGELKQLLEGMLNFDAYEVYSEYKARLRGFKIIG